MKVIVILISLVAISSFGAAQDYWSKTYDPFGHKFEDVRNIEIEDSVIYASCRGLCSSYALDECFKVAKFKMNGEFISGYEDSSFETGYGMEIDGDWIFVDGGNEPENTKIIVHQLSKDMLSGESIDVSVRNSFKLINHSMISTADHVIAFGSYRDSTKIHENGNYYANSVQVWVNRETFEVDTIIHIYPTTWYRVIHDMVNDDKGHVYSIGADDQENENGNNLTYLKILKQDFAGRVLHEFTYPVFLFGISEYYSSITIVNDNLVFRGGIDDVYNRPNIICVDTLGNKLWEHEYKEYREITPIKVVAGKNNQVFVLGLTESDEFGWLDVPFITCLDGLTGKALWERVYEVDKGQDPVFEGYAKFSELYDLEQLENGDIYVAGYVFNLYNDPDLGIKHDKDLWLMKLDSMGCLTPNCGYVQSIQNGVVVPDTCKWLQDDAKWYYTPWSLDFQDHLATIEIIGDTLIGNRLCSVLGLYEEDEFVENSDLIVFYERENEKVYFNENDTFKLMYNFSLAVQPGDTVEYYLPQKFEYYDISSSAGDFLPSDTFYRYRYIDQDWVTLENGEQHRIVTTMAIPNSELEGDCFEMSRVIDGVGSDAGLLGRNCIQVLGGKPEYFRCFKSNSLEYTEVNGRCLITSTDDNISDNLVSVFPNPGIDQLQIESEIQFKEVRIYDLSGKCVQAEKYKSSISLGLLSNGLYMLKLIGDEGIYRTKIVKGN